MNLREIRNRRTRIAISTAIVFALITLSRIMYVSLFAVDTPFWDQWDGEAAFLLKPWQDGTWQVTQLFSPHNEHRIAFTRVLSLLIFESNSEQWNNLVAAYINAFIAATYLTILFHLLQRNSGARERIVTLVTIACLAALPFSWENFLVGFQSQFYLMTLSAILMAALAAFKPIAGRTTLWLTVIGAASLVTAASGLAGAIAVIAMIALRAYQARRISTSDCLTAAMMLLVVLVGLYITPNIPSHAAMKAQGLGDNVNAILTALMWPIEPLNGKVMPLGVKLLAACILWCPSALLLLQAIRTRRSTSTDLFALGFGAWVFVQSVAIGHSRGHDIVGLASRYMDIPALGIVVNGYIACRLTRQAGSQKRGHVAFTVLAATFGLTAAYGFVVRTPTDIRLLEQRVYYTGKETTNVAAYMRTGDAHWLDQPLLEVPYPNAERLRSLLDDKTVAAMLPPSIRKPLPLRIGLNSGFSATGTPAGLPTAGMNLVSSFDTDNGHKAPRIFESDEVESAFPYLIVHQAGSRTPTDSATLRLSGNGNLTDFRSLGAAPTSWRRAYAHVPFERFTVVAKNLSAGEWTAFADPVEAGRLSVVASLTQDAVKKLLYKITPSLRPEANSMTSAQQVADPSQPSSTPPPGEITPGGECAVDDINSAPPAATETSITSTIVSIRGWAFISGKTGLASKELTLQFTDEHGESHFHSARRVPRPDVASVFGNTRLELSGFEVRVDARTYRGKFNMRILQTSDGEQLACPAPVIRLDFAR